MRAVLLQAVSSIADCAHFYAGKIVNVLNQDKVLNIYGYNLNDRAEKIPMDVFIEVANTLYNEQKCA